MQDLRGREILDCRANPAQDHRIAGRPIERFVGQRHQPQRSEACPKALEARGGDLPIGIAAGSDHQIMLSRRTLDEGGAKLRHQLEIVAKRCRERCVEGSWVVDHEWALAGGALTGRIRERFHVPRIMINKWL
jgi:hypothetical protein